MNYETRVLLSVAAVLIGVTGFALLCIHQGWTALGKAFTTFVLFGAAICFFASFRKPRS